jgi:hypothetical protein
MPHLRTPAETSAVTSPSQIVWSVDSMGFDNPPPLLARLLDIVERLGDGDVQGAAAEADAVLQDRAGRRRSSIVVRTDGGAVTALDLTLRRRLLRWVMAGGDPWGAGSVVSAMTFRDTPELRARAALAAAAEVVGCWAEVTGAFVDAGIDWRDSAALDPKAFSRGLAQGLAGQWNGMQAPPQWPFRADWRAVAGPRDASATPAAQLALAETLRVLGPERLSAARLGPLHRVEAAALGEAVAALGLVDTVGERRVLEAAAAQNNADLTVAELVATAQAAVA